jgi:photosystem II stability/assembly factor-like uncharacterized protein
MKSTHTNFVAGSLFFLLFVTCSCERREINSDNSFLSPQRTNKDLKKLEDVSPTKAGKISESEDSDWKSTKIIIGKREPISAISFINERVGWACNKKKVFKTEDSGKTWQSFKIDFVGIGEIVFFQFTDDLQGWLIVEDAKATDYSKNDRIRIYRTSDSGQSWKLTHSEMQVSFHDAEFASENGWVIAMKFVGDGASERSPLVLYFSNQDGWKDVSDPVKNLSYDPAYREGDLPALDCLTIKEDNCVIAVNKAEKIFQSCDKGKNWQILYDVGNFSPHSSYGPRQIGLHDDFIWIIESTSGAEGTNSILTIIPANENGKKKLISLPDYYITHGFAISAKELFLVGEPNNVSDKGLLNKGIVLNTKDSGETWNKIFSVAQEIKSAQFFPSQRVIWILTKGGELSKAISD